MTSRPQLLSTQLRDAYIAVGSAIAGLRSMPTRRRAADEEEFRIVEVTRNLQEAEHLLTEVGQKLGEPRIEINVEPHALGGGRAIGRPIVWEWIGALRAVRLQVAAVMSRHGVPIPDDLPDASWVEKTVGSPASQAVTTVLFGTAVVGLLVALVVSLVG